jgi:hypothetical protein
MQEPAKSAKDERTTDDLQHDLIATDELSLLSNNKLPPKRILIVGSAPDATLQPCDVAYFANYSALAFDHDQIIKHCSSIETVIKMSRLNPALFHGREKNVLLKCRNELEQLVVKTGCKITMCAVNEIDIPSIPPLDVPYQLIHSAELQDIYTIAAGSPPPYFHLFTLIKHAAHHPKQVSKLIKRIIELKLSEGKVGTRRVQAHLRPSAGITALAYALKVHGPEHEYHLTGISFNARDKHGILGDLNIARKPFPKHVMADRVFISHLLRRQIALSCD